ncbi:putative methyltransferase-like protein 25 [Haematobia irritans]|uniref:putative methyltransferase-like protein 25 n=1 Tax=Haematobia irritans TaxID=7368 RepID=UPI003F500AD0
MNMARSASFDSNYEYFKQVIKFLRKYSWAYEEANTCFIKSKTLEKMPKEFHHYFQNITTEDLNLFPQVHEPLVNNKPPHSVLEFRQQLAILIPANAFSDPLTGDKLIEVDNMRNMNLKKRHEIQRLANIINRELKFRRKCVLVDFGCGLGYLSEILYKYNKNFLILGLESDPHRVEAANKRLRSYVSKDTKNIEYSEHYITEESKDFITKSIENLLHSNEDKESTVAPSTAIIGLHACADLTITSMKLFLEMSHVKNLIIMPCCYHKMKMSSNNLEFQNFPLSCALKEVLYEEHSNGSSYVHYLNRPFLRLACQQTVKRWQKSSKEQHEIHGLEMFLRGTAEALTNKEGEMVAKSKKHFELGSISNVDFEMFSQLYHLKSKNDSIKVDWTQAHRQEFHNILQTYPDGDKLAEGLTCLQTSMQKLCENLVLYDRLCYIKEMASELKLNLNVHYEKLMDEELSPRCYALVAEKLN